MDFFLIFLCFSPRKCASNVRKYKKIKNVQNGAYDTSYWPELDGEAEGHHCQKRAEKLKIVQNPWNTVFQNGDNTNDIYFLI